jgi:ribonuclease P protein subunit POP4
VRNKKEILFHTFIGLPVEVVRCASRPLEGLKGTVVDETKNLLSIETENKVVKLQKTSCVFRFQLESGERVDVDGAKILFRPEERPKKVK